MKGERKPVYVIHNLIDLEEIKDQEKKKQLFQIDLNNSRL